MTKKWSNPGGVCRFVHVAGANLPPSHRRTRAGPPYRRAGPAPRSAGPGISPDMARAGHPGSSSALRGNERERDRGRFRRSVPGPSGPTAPKSNRDPVRAQTCGARGRTAARRAPSRAPHTAARPGREPPSIFPAPRSPDRGREPTASSWVTPVHTSAVFAVGPATTHEIGGKHACRVFFVPVFRPLKPQFTAASSGIGDTPSQYVRVEGARALHWACRPGHGSVIGAGRQPKTSPQPRGDPCQSSSRT